MPRVRVVADEYTLADRDKTYPKDTEIGVTDEEYQQNFEKLEFLSPTTDIVLSASTGRYEEKVRPDSKEVK